MTYEGCSYLNCITAALIRILEYPVQEATMAAGLYRQQAVEAQGASHLGALQENPSPSWLLVALLLTSFFALAAWAAGQTNYARKVAVSGYIDEFSTQEILTGEFTRLEQLHVEEGQTVSRGQPLARLVRHTLQETAAALSAEHAQQLMHLGKLRQAKRRTFNQQQRQLSGALQRQRKLLALGASDLRLQAAKVRQLKNYSQRMHLLLQRGYLSDGDWLRLKTGLVSELQRMNDIHRSVVGGKQRIAELHTSIAALNNSYEEAVTDIDLRLSDLRVATARSTSTLNLTAPADGRVSSIQVTEGDMLKPGDLLMHISAGSVADSATLELPAYAAGQLQLGDQVWLDLEAFPAARFGRVPAEVVHLSAHRVKASVFLARLRLDRTQTARGIKYLPGMGISTHVTLEQRPIVDWLFSPLLELLRAA